MRRWGRSIAALSGGALLVGLVAPAASAASTAGDDGFAPLPGTKATRDVGKASTREARPITRLIVKTRDGKTLSASGLAAAGALAGSPATPQARSLGRGQSLVYLGTALSTADAWKAAKQLAARADVVWAEPDLPVYATGDPSPVPLNDPQFPSQWDVWDSNATNGGFSTHVPRVWDRTKGDPSVVVAVIDTGLTAHPELTGSVTNPAASDPIVKGYDFVSLDTGGHAYTANDGNGRDADPSDPGDWITASDTAGNTAGGFFLNCPTETSSWHGTHVTGTIVAKQGNSVGITGMAPGVKVQPVRALGRCGGYTSDIDAAIEWASGGTVTGVPANATPASVINMSLGGPGACLPSTQQAITDAWSRGTTVVVAAGNSGDSLDPNSGSGGGQPADCDHVIRVTASTRAGDVSYFSSTGDASFPATIAAPGGGAKFGDNILSTVNSGTTVPVAPSYASYAGTSMATPHVAAAAALLQSTRAGRTPYTPDAVRDYLTLHAQPFTTGAQATVDNVKVDCTPEICGAGILDVSTLPTEAPLAPTVTVAQGDGQLDVSWTPGDTGGLTVTYDVETSTTGGAPWTLQVNATASTSASVTGLTNGTDYWVRVTATNTQGSATSAVVGPVRPASYAVGSPTATGGVERIAATWQAPTAPASSVTAYGLRYRVVGATDWLTATTPDASTLSTTLTPWPGASLPAGTYEVQIAALHDGLTVTDTGLDWSPSITAKVVALVNGVTASATVLRPFRDGFQDSVTVRVYSNNPTLVAGSLRIVNSSGVTVKIVPLPVGTANYWRFVWTGLNQKNVRVPNGRYYFYAYLPDRTGSLVLLPRPSVLVASSQATRPAISMSSTALYPVRDGYRDYTTIVATATVPAVFTMRVIRSGKIYYSVSFTRRTAAKLVYAGAKIGGGTLPAGSYYLYVYAKGGEGTTVVSAKAFAVSTKKAVKTAFKLPFTAYKPSKWVFYDTVQPSSDGTSIRVPGQSLVTFLAALPSSVLPIAYVRVTVGTTGHLGTPVRLFGFYGGAYSQPNYITPQSVTLTTWVSGYAPIVSYNDNKLRWYVANDASASTYWQISSFTVTGYKWVLV